MERQDKDSVGAAERKGEQNQLRTYGAKKNPLRTLSSSLNLPKTEEETISKGKGEEALDGRGSARTSEAGFAGSETPALICGASSESDPEGIIICI